MKLKHTLVLVGIFIIGFLMTTGSVNAQICGTGTDCYQQYTCVPNYNPNDPGLIIGTRCQALAEQTCRTGITCSNAIAGSPCTGTNFRQYYSCETRDGSGGPNARTICVIHGGDTFPVQCGNPGPTAPPQICVPNQWHPGAPNCGLETCGPSQSAQCNAEGTGWVCINNPELCTPTQSPTPTPPVTVNNPTGNTDLANCSVIAGWSCDRDNPDAQIQVAVFNGPYNPSDTSNFLGYFPANVGGGNGADSEAIAAACGSTNANIGHRFVVTFPQEWVNGQVYNIHVYGINIGGGQNVLIGSPISVNTATCLASPTATPTTAPSPTPSGACQLVRAYRPTGDLGIASNWGSPLTTAQLMQLRAGDTVYFTVVGNVTGGSVTAGRIRVNASTWSTRDVTTSFKPNAVGVDSSIREYYRAYVVPANTYSFTVGAEIYSPALDTNTNMNDGNLGWR